MCRRSNEFKSALGAIALGLAAMLPAGAAPLGPIVNGSFEDPTDFNGWVTVGNTSVQLDDFRTPADLFSQAVISSAISPAPGNGSSSTNIAGLDGFFNLSAGILEGYHAKSGSGLKQTFAGQANDHLAFSFDFATNEGSNPDFAFYTLTLPGGGTVFIPLSGSPLTPTGVLDNISGYFNKETGYQNATFDLPITGTYTLGFGVVNVNDTLLPSGLLVDAVTQQSAVGVPLPSGVYAIALSLLVVGACAPKIRRVAMA